MLSFISIENTKNSLRINCIRKSLLGVVLIILTLNGCQSTNIYKEPISDFREASSIVVDSTRLYLLTLNKVQRDAYILGKASSKQPIRLDEIEAKQVFTSDSINIRLDALKALVKYGESIDMLANNERFELLESNAISLKESIEKLNTDASKLSDSNNENFKKTLSPLVDLMTFFAEATIEKRLNSTIEESISRSEIPVQNLISTLKNDMITAFELKKSALSEDRVNAIDRYSNFLNSGANPSTLKNSSKEIISTLDLWERLPASNPSPALDAFVNAHSALVEFIKSKKQSSDILALSSKMDLFTNRARRALSAIRELQGI